MRRGKSPSCRDCQKFHGHNIDDNDDDNDDDDRETTMPRDKSVISHSFSMDHNAPILMEPRVVLFPLSEGNIETVKTPCIPASNFQALRSMVTPNMKEIQPCSNKEITALKRRLEAIKQKRAMHRNPPPSARVKDRVETARMVPDAIFSSNLIIDIHTRENNNHSKMSHPFNPRRLLCSTYGAKPISSSRSSKSSPDVESNDSMDRVCSKPQKLGIRGVRSDLMYSSLEKDEESSYWKDHYDLDHSRRVPPATSHEHQKQECPQFVCHPAEHRVGSLEHVVPREKAYSEIRSDGSEPSAQWIPSSRSCMPIRHNTPWYVRPSSNLDMVPNASSQVMNMVWFTTKE